MHTYAHSRRLTSRTLVHELDRCTVTRPSPPHILSNVGVRPAAFSPPRLDPCAASIQMLRQPNENDAVHARVEVGEVDGDGFRLLASPVISLPLGPLARRPLLLLLGR